MSDGMTDAFRSTLAAERRRMLFRSVVDSLQDWGVEMKRSTAVNDIMAFEKRLLNVNAGLDREAGALMFLDALHDQDRSAWASLLAFALCEEKNPELSALKALSPFRDKTLAVTVSSESRSRLKSTSDLTRAIEDQLEEYVRLGEYAPKLVVMELRVVEALDLRY